MPTQKQTTRQRVSPRVLAAGILTSLVFFGLGVKSSGDVQTIASLHANEFSSGDLTGDGEVTIDDAVEALEIVQGYKTATAEQRKADPDADGSITVTDALTILHLLSLPR